MPAEIDTLTYQHIDDFYRSLFGDVTISTIDLDFMDVNAWKRGETANDVFNTVAKSSGMLQLYSACLEYFQFSFQKPVGASVFWYAHNTESSSCFEHWHKSFLGESQNARFRGNQARISSRSLCVWNACGFRIKTWKVNIKLRLWCKRDYVPFFWRVLVSEWFFLFAARRLKYRFKLFFNVFLCKIFSL